MNFHWAIAQILNTDKLFEAFEAKTYPTEPTDSL